ncbi:YozE family protein [Fructilactobacillus vespulae]|uniref:YozE family protein n=1 Tax=Fructilactobacillus vespulae TaxID=1249630 RepID=UPI0039B386C8
MRKSFYEYLMTERNPDSHSEIAEFANNAFFDNLFPKHTNDFDLVSKYLEENASYLPSMTIFDEAWNKYLEYLD